ncbi:MAG: nuclear transport factor 2 family protein [Chitinophagaceae bacterium]|nr:nuclear transport factor 2 family protein [Chitinophagaceae bacterium]
MKRTLTILTLFISVTLFAQTDEAKLIRTIKEFHKALVDGNTISVNQQTDKMLSYGHSNGWIQNKNEVINDLKSGHLDYLAFTEDSVVVNINGNLASARFIGGVEASMDGVKASYKLRVLEVWTKKSNRWLLFARQAIRY